MIRFRRVTQSADWHEHPTDTKFIVLWGELFEHIPYDLMSGVCGAPVPNRARFCAPSVIDGTLSMRCRYGTGSIIRRKAKCPHRFEVAEGKSALIMVIMSEKEPTTEVYVT